MKFKLLSFAAITLVLNVTNVSAQQTASQYNGNGATGFGGGIGNSSLSITSDATTITFSLTTTAAGFSGNGLALYIDSNGTASGFNSTASFSYSGSDGGRTALAGNSSNGRTVATFASGFTADYGIAIQPGVYAGLYSLNSDGSFNAIGSANLTTNGTLLTFSVNRSDLGLSAAAGFTFEASLISTTGYRSNETIGTSVTAPDPANLGTAPNAGYTGTTTFSNFDTYGTPVPEPATWAAGGLTVLAGAGALRRRLRAV